MKNKIVIYEDEKGNVELRADVEKDTIWATQEQISQLFEVSIPNISMHFRNIFQAGELDEVSVVKDFLITAKDGKRYKVKSYNLDAIIAVGYRVSSKKATQFRIWATGVLREYLKEGYALNRYKLDKTPEAIEGLHEAVAFIESENNPGRLKGKIILKLEKNLNA